MTEGGRRVPVYRYVFADLVTDGYIDEFDLDRVSFDRRICEAGSFSATLNVPNRTVADRAARIVPRLDGDFSAGPGRTVCHVYRNGALWGSYIVWQATPSADDRGRISIGLRGSTLESWLHHREIRTDLVFDQVDQLEICRRLVDVALHPLSQAGIPGADIGMEIADTGASGVLRDRTYLASEAATYGRRLEQLAEVLDGPEWMIRTFLDADGSRRRVFVAADRLGSDAQPHRFSQPGDVVSWSYSADATDAATAWQTRGDTPNEDIAARSEPLMSDWWYSVLHLAHGWPLLERTEDYQSVADPATLNAYARWWAARRSGMVRIPQVEVRLPEEPTFTPEHVGDRARITLLNDWFPARADGSPSFSKSWRVVGLQISPADRGSGQDTARLIFEEPTDHPADTDPNAGG